MAIWKNLAWAAAGVGAVVAIPATGGGSLVALIGAAGTTTAAGAALGAAGGVAAKTLVDEFIDDKDETIDRLTKEAETNKAGWAKAEELRAAEAEKSQAIIAEQNIRLEELVSKYKETIESLQKSKFTLDEIEMMFILASAAAYSDGNVSESEFDSAAEAISLLSAQPEKCKEIGRKFFVSPIPIDEAMGKIRQCRDKVTLQRLGFVLDMVIHADGYIDAGEQKLLELFGEHLVSIDAAL